MTAVWLPEAVTLMLVIANRITSKILIESREVKIWLISTEEQFPCQRAFWILLREWRREICMHLSSDL